MCIFFGMTYFLSNIIWISTLIYIINSMTTLLTHSYLILCHLQNENPGPGTYKGYEQTNNDVSPSYSKRGTGTFASKVQQLL